MGTHAHPSCGRSTKQALTTGKVDGTGGRAAHPRRQTPLALKLTRHCHASVQQAPKASLMTKYEFHLEFNCQFKSKIGH
jgi:hypothetical protein